MNGDTVTLIERPYQEIVADILTAVVGGVVNEPILFDVKEDLYALSQTAGDVRGITGTLDTKHHAFQKQVDFIFDGNANAVVWQAGGGKPDDDTVFYVDYFRRDTRSPLSDINVGSVTRTLSEAIGREIATVYQQVNQAYLSGFIDTATGQSLDLVVAILGITRKTADYAIGLVTFFRDTAASDGNITIPIGTSLSTAKGEATFVTTELRTLQRGQVRIDIPVRAGDASKGKAGIVPAGAITTLAQPIAGIARVTNLDATVLGSEAENDADLRARAKAALRGLGKATLAALLQAVFEERSKVAGVWDPNGPSAQTSPPGSVILLVQTEAKRFPSLQGRIQETRAAGVLATLVAQFVFFKPRIKAVIAPGMTPPAAAGKQKLVSQIIEAMQNYVDGLSAGAPVKGADLQKAIVDNVKTGTAKALSAVTFLDVTTWRSDVGQPGPETLVDALLDAIAVTGCTDANQLRDALTNVVSAKGPNPPGSRRIPDRSLVQSLAPERSGQPANDADIEAAKFQVMPPDATWSIVLDAAPADILLVES